MIITNSTYNGYWKFITFSFINLGNKPEPKHFPKHL